MSKEDYIKEYCNECHSNTNCGFLVRNMQCCCIDHIENVWDTCMDHMIEKAKEYLKESIGNELDIFPEHEAFNKFIEEFHKAMEV